MVFVIILDRPISMIVSHNPVFAFNTVDIDHNLFVCRLILSQSSILCLLITVPNVPHVIRF